MRNDKMAGYAHTPKPDLRKVYLIPHTSVYSNYFYPNYLHEHRMYIPNITRTSWYTYQGITNSAIEHMRLW